VSAAIFAGEDRCRRLQRCFTSGSNSSNGRTGRFGRVEIRVEPRPKATARREPSQIERPRVEKDIVEGQVTLRLPLAVAVSRRLGDDEQFALPPAARDARKEASYMAQPNSRQYRTDRTASRQSRVGSQLRS